MAPAPHGALPFPAAASAARRGGASGGAEYLTGGTSAGERPAFTSGEALGLVESDAGASSRRSRSRDSSGRRQPARGRHRR